jgi:hypothetical protein
MTKIHLPNITLLGIDCVNIERLQSAMDISENGIKFGAVKLLTSLPTEDTRLVEIPHINSIEDFSRFCITELYKYVETDYVLLVQYDGFILNPESWNPEFLNYDYIGAPLWAVKDLRIPGSPLFVGNGGFCIRSKKFLETSARLASEGTMTKLHPEDVALCVWYRDVLEREGITFAPPELAMKFSVVEDHGVYDKPFGFHGLFNKNMDTLISRYPDFPLHFFLPRRREKLLEKVKKVFDNIGVEVSILKSKIDYSADVHLTLKDKDIKEVFEKRFEYFSQIGEVQSIYDNTEGDIASAIKSSVVYVTKVGLLPINFYFSAI